MIGERIGNFRVVAELGKGGMGEVFLAEHEKIGTKVAIKMLLPHISANTEHVQRFFNEAIAASKITHSGIGKIFDVGFTSAGRAYLVMEFLAGETLARRIERLGRLPVREIAEIGKQIASVLDAVHKAGITHRDLKPDNIFIVPDSELDSGERVKILDFGIAKLSSSGGVTMTGAGAMGTPDYMSPEQWKNVKNVDWRADAYSLGCLTFEMAAGRRPFLGESIGELCTKHLLEPPPRLSALAPQASALDALVDRLLAKEPEQRPASMKEIGAAFAAILAVADRAGFAETIAPSASLNVPQQGPYAPVPPTLPPTVSPGAPPPIPRTPPPSPNTPRPVAKPAVSTLNAAAGQRDVVPTVATGSRSKLVLLAGALVALAAIVVVLVMKVSGGTPAPLPSAVAPADASEIATTTPDASAELARPDAELVAAIQVAPDAAPIAPAPPISASEPAAAARPLAPAPVVARHGTLNIFSKPPTEIFVDGKNSGLHTPQRDLRVQAGTRRVTLVNNEFGIRESFAVEVKPDEVTKVVKDYSAKLEALDTPPPSKGGGCDEVSCVLNNYEGTCCQRFKKGGASAAPQPRDPNGLPDGLDRAMISYGIGLIKARVTACGDKSPAQGKVKVKVRVTPDGRVSSTSIETTPDPALGACVAAAVQKATFEKTLNGGSFSYPFQF